MLETCSARSAAVAAVRSQLQGIRLGRAAALSAATLFLVAWLADAACLVCALLALGVTPPWSSLLVAYSAAQLVSFLPVTPGGLGLVEGSLTMTLGARGGTGAIVAGVMLYRGISYWATLPVGLAGYLNLRRTRSRRHPPPAARGAASAPVPGGVALEGAAR